MENTMENPPERVLPIVRTNSPAKFAPSNVRAILAEKMIFLKAIELVARMLSSYPPSAATSDSYIGSLAAALMEYPPVVAEKCADPIRGVARECITFKPTTGAVIAWCECELASLREIVRRDDQKHSEAAERKRAAEAERKQQEDRARRPPLEQLREKYGPNWGLKGTNALDAIKPPVDQARRRDSRDQTALEMKFLAEYARLGCDPIYAGDMLVSPELADMLRPIAVRNVHMQQPTGAESVEAAE
jgi:hypothetical protein